MPSSYIQFCRRGFWARDCYIQAWLEEVVKEIDKTPQREPWLRGLREDWERQALVDGGIMCLELDEWLIDSQRERELLRIIERTLIAIRASGSAIEPIHFGHLVKLTRWVRKLLQHESPFSPGDRDFFRGASTPTCPRCGLVLLTPECEHCKELAEWLQKTRDKPRRLRRPS